MKDILTLFIAFFKIGSFTFGGGYSMLPFIKREFADRLGWVSNEEIIDFFAISQCIPGVIAVNTATFVGHKRKGVVGAITAALGVVLPSIIIIIIIASIIQNLYEYEIVANILNGIRVVVAVLIINAVLTMWKSTIVDKILILIAFLSAVLMFINVSPVYIIISGAVLGIIISRVKGGMAK